MKTKIVFISLLLVFGCKDYNIKTAITKDGSSTRTVIVSPISKNLDETAFPIPTGDGWDTTWSKNEEEKNVLTTTKNFDSLEELNAEFANPIERKIRDSVSAIKKFRWFYTYFEYTEVLKSYNPFNTVPISGYLSEEELRGFLTSDSDSLKEKVEKWQADDLYNYFMKELSGSFAKLNEDKLTKEFIYSKKDTITNYFSENGDNHEEAASVLADIYGVQSIKTLQREVAALLNDIEAKLDWAGTLSGKYRFEVELPGIVLSTNSKSLEGNTASWEVDSEKFYAVDFIMTAESRVVNTWAMIATGILALLLIVVLLVPAFKRR